MDMRRRKNPKNKLFNMRMNTLELQQLEICSKWLNKSKSEVLLRGLELQYSEYRKWERKQQQHKKNMSTEQAYIEWLKKNGLE